MRVVEWHYFVFDTIKYTYVQIQYDETMKNLIVLEDRFLYFLYENIKLFGLNKKKNEKYWWD